VIKGGPNETRIGPLTDLEPPATSFDKYIQYAAYLHWTGPYGL